MKKTSIKNIQKNKPFETLFFMFQAMNFFICFLCLILIFPISGNAQMDSKLIANSKTYSLGLLGNTSLIFVPTAYIVPENNLSIGFSHIDKLSSFVVYSQEYEVGEHVKYLNLGYLSFLEITLRLTKPYGSKNTFGIGDRSYFIKIQALKERDFLPAVAVGIHDWFTRATNFHTGYIVLSKSMDSSEKPWSIHTHLGYGNKVQETENNYLIGVFGGIDFNWKFLTVLAEYDAKTIHAGLKFNIKDIVFFQATLLNMKKIGGGINVRFKL